MGRGFFMKYYVLLLLLGSFASSIAMEEESSIDNGSLTVIEAAQFFLGKHAGNELYLSFVASELNTLEQQKPDDYALLKVMVHNSKNNLGKVYTKTPEQSPNRIIAQSFMNNVMRSVTQTKIEEWQKAKRCKWMACLGCGFMTVTTTTIIGSAVAFLALWCGISVG